MVRKYKIRKAIRDDEKWIIEIFKENKKILGGAGYGKLQWKRFWDNEKNNEHWIVIEGVCFCHYLTRIKDGVNVVYEIATKSSEKRKGFGRKIIDFKETGISYTKSNNKKMQNYEYTDIKGLFDE